MNSHDYCNSLDLGARPGFQILNFAQYVIADAGGVQSVRRDGSLNGAAIRIPHSSAGGPLITFCLPGADGDNEGIGNGTMNNFP